MVIGPPNKFVAKIPNDHPQFGLWEKKIGLKIGVPNNWKTQVEYKIRKHSHKKWPSFGHFFQFCNFPKFENFSFFVAQHNFFK